MSDQSKPPFISDQSVFQLTAPWGEREEWLHPARFRKLKRITPKDDESDQSAEREEVAADPSPYAWEEQPSREALFSDPNIRLMCLTDDAGMGKTIALKQIQYLRAAADAGHLAIWLNFDQLPADFNALLGKVDGQTPILVREIQIPCGAQEVESPDLQRQLLGLIRRKIREGRLTLLVDAMDQSNQSDKPRQAAEALAAFLRTYPMARCVISGRPFSIWHYWKPLFSQCGSRPEDAWELVQLDSFTGDQRDRFLGPLRADKLKRLQGDVLAIPRALETIRRIKEAELDSVRTLADVYWRCVANMLEKAKDDQPIKISDENALFLFALLAFEMVSHDQLAGVESDPLRMENQQMKTFVRKLWTKRKRQLIEQLGYPDDVRRDEFEEDLGRLAALNAGPIEPGVIKTPIGYDPLAPKLTQIVWRDRTLQDFFAALWVTQYAFDPDTALEDDRQWLQEHLYVCGVDWDEKSTQHPQLYEFWRLACEMPPGARQDSHYVQAMRALYAPERNPDNPVRSTEMIYRSWPTMLTLAGYLNKPDWDEVNLSEPTQQAQQEAQNIIETHGEIDDEPNVAKQALLRVLGEFHEYRCGRRGEKAQQKLARQFHQDWFTPIPPQEVQPDQEQRFTFWMGDAQSSYDDEPLHESQIEGRFLLAKYPVTNALYEMFDAQHSSRFGDYTSYASQPECPAIYLTWYDAWCVAIWLGGELPTEHQWEYACRAQPGLKHSPTRWCFSDDESELPNWAWYEENSNNQTHPVGEKKENAFGLFDMHGNVWEWTSSWYHEDPEQGRDIKYIGSSRVLRGGAFNLITDVCRSAYRNIWHPALTIINAGVRVSRARKP